MSALEEKGLRFTLKPDQDKALRQLYNGKDLIAVLPTGYGKSLIFQLLSLLAKKCDRNESASVLVTCPLTSIVQDQLLEVEAMGIRACSLDNNLDKLWDIEAGKYDIVYGSAEIAINEGFLESLKKDTNLPKVILFISISCWRGCFMVSQQQKLSFSQHNIDFFSPLSVPDKLTGRFVLSEAVFSSKYYKQPANIAQNLKQLCQSLVRILPE